MSRYTLISLIVFTVAAVIVPPSSDARSSATFSWATNPERIGSNPAYLEKVLGPAERKDDISWSFEVQGCEITYALEDNSVVSFGAEISPSCHMLVNGMPITHATTFGQVGRVLGGDLTSYCIGGSCGNAADPTIDLFIPGSRATGFIDTRIDGKYDTIQQRAMDIWQASIRRQHGSTTDDLDYRLFNCISSPPPAVTAVMRNERVNSVTIGRDLDRLCKDRQ